MEKEKWTTARSRHVPALWPIYAYFNWDYAKHFNVHETGKIIHIWDKGDLTAIFETKPRKPLTDSILNYLKLNKDKLESVRKKGIESGEEVVRLTKEFCSQIESKTNEEISSFYSNFSEMHKPLMRDNMFIWLIPAIPLEQEIRSILTQYSQKEQDEIFEILSRPSIDSYSKKIEKELDEITNLFKKGLSESEEFKKIISDFIEKYYWFPYEYVGPNIWTKESILQKISDDIHKEENTENSDSDIVEKQKQIIAKFQLKQDIVDLFSILRALTLMQDDRKMFMTQICYWINSVLSQELTKRFNLSMDEAHYIDPILFFQPEQIKTKLKERTNFMILVQENLETTIYTGDIAKEYLKNENIQYHTSDENIKEVKGQIANSGIISGKVRVLKTSQINDFNTGDIIVTGMTTPDFAPLMKKAAAIVTDEGGITCHAAIVSRELSIPCIIGTKIATKVFKDGDLVEVDANIGIIKKI